MLRIGIVSADEHRTQSPEPPLTPFRPSRIGLACLALFAAITLTTLSIYVQRKGPEEVVYSNLCGPTMNDLCYKKVLKGGFPAAYLFDAPGVSVEDQLAFFEDNFHGQAFLIDVAAYFAVILLALSFLRRRNSALAYPEH